ncbi:MAG TPA: GntR family transcriptional regulator [Streptosporangiaceae bacterium]|nr:GntR family transcriptional regulator [Streptosporangiaceae bacterium]
MSANEPIALTSYADEIAFRLEAEILDGAYAPGSHLMQEEICARFGVSRTPVREALRKLQAQNLVDLVPHKGARIRVITLSELAEVYAVRAEMEGYAAALAAGAFSRDEVAALESIQSQLEAVVASLQLPESQRPAGSFINAQLTRFNEEFHGVIRDVGGNRLLDRLIADLQRRFPKDYVWRTIDSRDQIQAINVTEHRRILEALKANDADAARAAMSVHVRNAGRLILGHLQQRGAAT